MATTGRRRASLAADVRAVSQCSRQSERRTMWQDLIARLRLDASEDWSEAVVELIVHVNDEWLRLRGTVTSKSPRLTDLTLATSCLRLAVSLACKPSEKLALLSDQRQIVVHCVKIMRDTPAGDLLPIALDHVRTLQSMLAVKAYRDSLTAQDWAAIMSASSAIMRDHGRRGNPAAILMYSLLLCCPPVSSLPDMPPRALLEIIASAIEQTANDAIHLTYLLAGFSHFLLEYAPVLSLQTTLHGIFQSILSLLLDAKPPARRFALESIRTCISAGILTPSSPLISRLRSSLANLPRMPNRAQSFHPTAAFTGGLYDSDREVLVHLAALAFDAVTVTEVVDTESEDDDVPRGRPAKRARFSDASGCLAHMFDAICAWDRAPHLAAVCIDVLGIIALNSTPARFSRWDNSVRAALQALATADDIDMHRDLRRAAIDLCATLAARHPDVVIACAPQCTPSVFSITVAALSSSQAGPFMHDAASRALEALLCAPADVQSAAGIATDANTYKSLLRLMTDRRVLPTGPGLLAASVILNGAQATLGATAALDALLSWLSLFVGADATVTADDVLLANPGALSELATSVLYGEPSALCLSNPPFAVRDSAFQSACEARLVSSYRTQASLLPLAPAATRSTLSSAPARQRVARDTNLSRALAQKVIEWLMDQLQRALEVVSSSTGATAEAGGRPDEISLRTMALCHLTFAASFAALDGAFTTPALVERSGIVHLAIKVFDHCCTMVAKLNQEAKLRMLHVLEAMFGLVDVSLDSFHLLEQSAFRAPPDAPTSSIFQCTEQRRRQLAPLLACINATCASLLSVLPSTPQSETVPGSGGSSDASPSADGVLHPATEALIEPGLVTLQARWRRACARVWLASICLDACDAPLAVPHILQSLLGQDVTAGDYTCITYFADAALQRALFLELLSMQTNRLAEVKGRKQGQAPLFESIRVLVRLLCAAAPVLLRDVDETVRQRFQDVYLPIVQVFHEGAGGWSLRTEIICCLYRCFLHDEHRVFEISHADFKHFEPWAALSSAPLLLDERFLVRQAHAIAVCSVFDDHVEFVHETFWSALAPAFRQLATARQPLRSVVVTAAHLMGRLASSSSIVLRHAIHFLLFKFEAAQASLRSEVLLSIARHYKLSSSLELVGALAPVFWEKHVSALSKLPADLAPVIGSRSTFEKLLGPRVIAAAAVRLRSLQPLKDCAAQQKCSLSTIVDQFADAIASQYWIASVNDPGAAAQFLKLLTGANVDVTLVITPAPNMPLASLLWSLFSMFDGYTINGDDNVLDADVISNFKCLCYTGARGDWLASIEHKWAPTTSLDAILSALQSFCGAMHTGGSLSVLLKSAPLLALALLRHAHVAIEKCPFASERARLLHCYLAVVSACGPLLAYDAILLDVMTTLFAVAKLDGGMLRDQAVFAAVGLCESVVPLAAGPDFDALLERCLFDLFAMASDAYTLAAQDPTSDGSMLVSDFIGLLARAASTPSFQQAAATLTPPAALRRHPAFEALAPTRALLPAPLHIGYIIQQNRPCGASDLADLRVLLSKHSIAHSLLCDLARFLVRHAAGTPEEARLPLARLLGDLQTSLGSDALQPAPSNAMSEATMKRSVIQHCLSAGFGASATGSAQTIKVAARCLTNICRMPDLAPILAAVECTAARREILKLFEAEAAVGFAMDSDDDDAGELIFDIEAAALWAIPTDDSYVEWVRRLAHVLAASVEAPFLNAVAPLAAIHTSVAELVLPFAIAVVCETKPNAASLPHHLRSVVQQYRVAPRACVLAIVDSLLLVRHRALTKSDAKKDRRPLNLVEPLLAAEAAAHHGALETALLLTEIDLHSIARPNTPLFQPPPALPTLAQGRASPHEAHRKLLLHVYSCIDDPDALYAVNTALDLDSQMRRFTHEGDWMEVLNIHSMQDAPARAADSASMVTALQRLGMQPTVGAVIQGLSSSSTSLSADLMEAACGALWRNSDWRDDGVRHTSGALGQQQFVYQAIRCVATEQRQDLHTLLSAFAAPLIMQRTKTPHSADERRSVAVSLHLVAIASDALDVLSNADSLAAMRRSVDKWERLADRVRLHHPFDESELILAVQNRLLHALWQRLPSGDHEEGLKLYTRHTSSFARLARKAGSPRIGRHIVQCATTDIVARAGQQTPPVLSLVPLHLEHARLFHAIRATDAAVQLANAVADECETSDSPSARLLQAESLRLLGALHSELRSESPDVILDYLLRADRLAESLLSHDASRDSHALAKVFHTAASFADAQYRLAVESLSSNSQVLMNTILTRRARPVAASAAAVVAAIDGSAADTGSSVSRSGYDEHSVLLSERVKQFWSLATEHYLKALRFGDEHNLDVYRACSLWYDRFDMPALQEASLQVDEWLATVPAAKFVPLVLQLVARLRKSDNQFQHMLRKLLMRLAAEHPYHTLYPLFALKNSSATRNWQSKKSSSSSTNGNLADAMQEKAEAASMLLQSISDPQLREKAQMIDLLCNGYLQLSDFVVEPKVTAGRIQPDILMRLSQPVPVVSHRLPLHVDASVPTVHSIEPDFVALSGPITRPKRIVCRGSDGRSYWQLVKGDDELRQDAIMSQTFEIINTLLQRNVETHRRRLRLVTYVVVPMALSGGVVEWLQDTRELLSTLGERSTRHAKEYIELSGKRKELEKELLKATHKGNLQEQQAAAAQLKECFATTLNCYRALAKDNPPVLHRVFWRRFGNAAQWFEKRRNFTRSVASISIAGYVMGLGDRHLSNILIHDRTCEAIHIDFGVAFDAGLLLPIPELVPFRLTRNLVDGMGVTGVEGVFRRSCEKTMHVLRDQSSVLLTVVEALKHDPLYKWRRHDASLHPRGRHPAAAAAGSSEEALHAILRLQQKLKGQEDGVTLDVPGQVNLLIRTAMDENLLSRMFHGWLPYM